ncbi:MULTISPECIES: hypothetical protein [Trichocoleus]|uniref:Uncharacterized protein n=1 Tax=Trichocoleus desertorum GB2-A4 TaxID=2933944 RepID=A0ABV0JER7_9CYAN|nr:hypothetical protein [Trichocoleus sp. FACHB-46]MBD1865589.1 hypothetical protein [Trichocoleus sp. FACHB-46]
MAFSFDETPYEEFLDVQSTDSGILALLANGALSGYASMNDQSSFEELLAARTKTLNDIQAIITRIRYLVDIKVTQAKLEQQWQKAKL